MNMQLPDPHIRLRHATREVALGHAVSSLYATMRDYDVFRAPIERTIGLLGITFARLSATVIVDVAASCELFSVQVKKAYDAAEASGGTNEDSSKHLEDALGRIGEIQSFLTAASATAQNP